MCRESYIFAFGLKIEKIILHILPEYLCDEEYRESNSIGMIWRKSFDNIESAKRESLYFVYDELVIVENSGEKQ